MRHIKTRHELDEISENLNISSVLSSKTNKPQMVFNFRISNDSSGNQRFTEEKSKTK